MELFFYQNKKAKFIRVNPDDNSSYDWMDKNRFIILKIGALEALREIKSKIQEL